MSAPSLLAAYSLYHGPPVIFSLVLQHSCVTQEDDLSLHACFCLAPIE